MTDSTTHSGDRPRTVDPADRAADRTTVPPTRRSAGTVVDFDGAVGLGAIADGTGQRWAFHAAAISDGSRTIDVGQAVTFTAHARFGRLEASDIVAAG